MNAEKLNCLILFYDGLSHLDDAKSCEYGEGEKRLIIVRLRWWCICTEGLFCAFCKFLFSICFCRLCQCWEVERSRGNEGVMTEPCSSSKPQSILKVEERPSYFEICPNDHATKCEAHIGMRSIRLTRGRMGATAEVKHLERHGICISEREFRYMFSFISPFHFRCSQPCDVMQNAYGGAEGSMNVTGLQGFDVKRGALFDIFVTELDCGEDFYVSIILNNCQQRQLWLIFNFRFLSKMDPLENKEVETLSLNGDVIDMDINYGTDGMSDSEIQSELVNLQQENDSNELEVTVIERPKVKDIKILATPKVSSVVVVPESSNRPNITKPRSSSVHKKDSKTSKGNNNRNSSSNKNKNSSKTSAGSLVSMLSKVTVTKANNSTSSTDNAINTATRSVAMSSQGAGGGTPSDNKRNRSDNSTPESCQKQPNKMVKTGRSDQTPAPPAAQTYSLVVRRSLNVKICLSTRPPTGQDLPNVKRFLQSKIEDALSDRATFLPIFNDPCKIGLDGVYVFCTDFKCAEWISSVVKNGIPSIECPLIVLPQDTPLKYKPELIMVRTIACIPTKKQKADILDNIAQMNRDLNTEKWYIRNIRPKGSSSSTVYMKMDKKSYDEICARENKVNWILGPITITLEEHRPKAKKHHLPSAANKAAVTDYSKSVNHHSVPPSTGSVDCIPKRPRPTRNGESCSKGQNKQT